MKLSNNTIAITGGGSGIGFALAKEFSKFRNQIILIGRDEQKLKSAQSSIPNSHYYCCDLTDGIQLSSLISDLQQDFPDLNVIINNAGMMSIDNLLVENIAKNNDQKQFQINYFAPIRLIDGLLVNLLQQKRPVIINVSTALVYVPFGATPSYCASKAALHAYTSSLRVQLKESQVKVFEILPPVVSTSMSSQLDLKGILPQDFARRVVKKLKMNKEEIRIGQANALYFMSRFFPKWIQHKMNQKSYKTLMTNG